MIILFILRDSGSVEVLRIMKLFNVCTRIVTWDKNVIETVNLKTMTISNLFLFYIDNYVHNI